MGLNMACLERNICFVYNLDNIIKVGCTIRTCINDTSTIHIMTQKDRTPCHCWVWHTLTPPCRFLLQTISEEQEHHLHPGPEGGHFESCWIGGAHPGPTYSSERRQQGENQNTTHLTRELQYAVLASDNNKSVMANNWISDFADYIPFCSYVMVCLGFLCFTLC